MISVCILDHAKLFFRKTNNIKSYLINLSKYILKKNRLVKTTVEKTLKLLKKRELYILAFIIRYSTVQLLIINKVS